jgi:hypothetical protein
VPALLASERKIYMPKITFEVESDAEPLLIVSMEGARTPTNEVIKLTPAGSAKRKGDITVPSDKPVFLMWIFTGSPGKKFKIEIGPKDKIKLKRSNNPIESSISTSRPVNSGSDQFEVKP